MEGAENAPEQQDRAFAPLFGAARTFLARGGLSRGAILAHVRPRPHDLIVDMQCGGGGLVRRLAEMEPAARIIGANADEAAVARARRRPSGPRASLRFVHADADDIARRIGSEPATKVIVTLADIHSPSENFRRLEAARAIIDPLGELFVIDVRRASATRALREVSHAFAAASSGRSGDLATPLIRNAGFVAVEEAARWTTTLGAVALIHARAS